MKITFKSRNIEITEAMREYAEKRLSKFDKLIGAEEAIVTMRSVKDRQRLEVTIPYHGMLIRGEEEGYDMYTCIDNVAGKLETQIHKYRTRLIKRGRQSRDAQLDANGAHWLEDDQPVKVKSFSTKPISTEEAIMQMNLLGHNFFVFFNIEDDKVNVLYRRYDGEYGLLIPEN